MDNIISKSVYKRLSIQVGPEKPKFGDPCNGCGFCCAAEICKLGKKIFQTEKLPCPGLIWKDKKFRCQIVELVNEEQRPFLYLMMGINIGCDSD